MDKEELYDHVVDIITPLCDRPEPSICQIMQYVEDNRKGLGLIVEVPPTVH